MLALARLVKSSYTMCIFYFFLLITQFMYSCIIIHETSGVNIARPSRSWDSRLAQRCVIIIILYRNVCVCACVCVIYRNNWSYSCGRFASCIRVKKTRRSRDTGTMKGTPVRPISRAELTRAYVRVCVCVCAAAYYTYR